ncbi:NodT family efflux transporter outer membrane factor (OMF) lipoprotein [Pseudomonas migulae]|uniref:efflux transporter outer membrane subunit n=1 Tax=Pseudomonas migulae TaxID=78543 RepID=UPI0020A0FA08|nr:efflux transporter outer membrane subunit [Pseudomonas migulae]MCP1496517.1 NodT family efflux transporter outer membrane factor (OMF) lipoprotein [Pseudomonas migulae]
MNNLLRTPSLVLGAALLSACASPVMPPNSEVPVERFVNAQTAQPASVTDLWWTRYQDPLLDRLVERALGQNLDLQIALARIDAGRALRNISAASGSPQVDLGASAARQRISADQAGFTDSLITEPASIGLSAAWEIDLFGRIREGVRAADADLNATEDEARGVRVALITEVVQAYAEARGLEERLAIVKQSAASQAETLQLTEQLYAAGDSPEADVLRARSQSDSTAAQVPALQLNWQRSLHRLSVLLAQPTETLYQQFKESPANVSTVSSLDAGTPADLLRRRPDIRAAEARLIAAYARVGVAKADLMPRLSLSAALGSLIDGVSAANLASSTFWLAGLNASVPVLDGGRRRNVVDLRDAEARQALLSYRRTVLTAVSEVESALAAAQRNAERRTFLSSAASQASSAAEQIQRAWQAGETPFLDVLQAQRVQLAAQNALSQVKTAQWQNQAALVNALGG